MRRTYIALLFAAILISLSSLAPAQDQTDDKSNPDEAAIHEYLLTIPKLQKYSEVVRKMNEAGKSEPAMVAEMKKISDSDAYNVHKAEMMEKSPHLAAFLKANGMTTREFVLTPVVALTAAMATAAQDLKAEPPAFVNPANIQFVRDHKAELEKYNLMGGEKVTDEDGPEKDGPDDKQ
jgi:hypothetical protein